MAQAAAGRFVFERNELFMEINLAELALGAAAVWRMTHLLQAEDGPWNVVARLRGLASDTLWANILNCFYCLSVWTALPIAAGLGADWTGRLILWPALSGAAILLERSTTREQQQTPVAQWHVESDTAVSKGENT